MNKQSRTYCLRAHVNLVKQWQNPGFPRQDGNNPWVWGKCPLFCKKWKWLVTFLFFQDLVSFVQQQSITLQQQSMKNDQLSGDRWRTVEDNQATISQKSKSSRSTVRQTICLNWCKCLVPFKYYIIKRTLMLNHINPFIPHVQFLICKSWTASC